MEPRIYFTLSSCLIRLTDTDTATIILNVRFTPNYPDEAPDLDITQPPNAPKHPYLDIQEDKTVLLSSLNEPITDNLGMQMIFTLVTTLKDSAELLITERQGAKAALAEMEAQRAEEEENKKFQGEAVTRDSFLKWREEFQRELFEEEQRKKEEQEADDKKKGRKEEKKLTGRELWERGLAGKIEEDEGEDALAHIKDLKIEASS